jgi:bacillithiol synthase
MNVEQLSFEQTGYFSNIVLDYLKEHKNLKGLYNYAPKLSEIPKAIAAKKNQLVLRNELVKHLHTQYQHVDTTISVRHNVDALAEENTFTITTAHQPNLFTGQLYFFYKIIHAIKMAQECAQLYPQYNFVPVYYIGHEDADVEELNFINLYGDKISWNNAPTGAFGEAVLNNEVEQLRVKINQTLGVLPHANEVLKIFNVCYAKGKTVKQATFEFVDALFGQYGLVVVIADSVGLKQQMVDIFTDDLLNNSANKLVEETSVIINKNYKAQAHSRPINLFYLVNNERCRIVFEDNLFKILNTNLVFSKDELLQELQQTPQKFSPNVILRGLFQETILPNICYIGGGGELAYWLQLKTVFEHYGVPYPLLMLRNSFLFTEKKYKTIIDKWQIETKSLFLSYDDLVKNLLTKQATEKLNLSVEIFELEKLYTQIGNGIKDLDTTLLHHTNNLKAKAVKRLHQLELKMLRASKKKNSALTSQILKLKNGLFPNRSLQERVDNALYYLCNNGVGWIDEVLKATDVETKSFTIIYE